MEKVERHVCTLPKEVKCSQPVYGQERLATCPRLQIYPKLLTSLMFSE